MEPINPKSSEEQGRNDEQAGRKKLLLPSTFRKTSTLERKPIEAMDTVKTKSVAEAPIETLDTAKTPGISRDDYTNEARYTQVGPAPIETIATIKTPAFVQEPPIDAIDTRMLEVQYPAVNKGALEAIDTQKMVSNPLNAHQHVQVAQGLTRGKAVLLAVLLCVIVLHATSLGSSQFLGSQGWAYVLGGPMAMDDSNALKNLIHRPALGATATTKVPITPQQHIEQIIQHMSLDQKLGQMMIVQFTGPTYSLDLGTMISQYGAGAVIIFSTNNNIVDKTQLKDLIQQMQSSTTVPLAVAIDQEGGYVDRLVHLDGPRPSEATLGATNDPNKAMAAGSQDAQDLTYYGINLNLAPVVDVTNVYNPQLDTRTYGNNAPLVTKMAAAYLQGLQQSGKVLGTLKHFPGLGDVGVDPHNGVPYLTRSKSDLEQIDWAPYRTLIQQGSVHAIMVTHEIVPALDDTKPSSLSKKVIHDILRDEMGFKGVIMTDSLTMEGITAYYSEGQAAALAIEAGSDLLMGASTPSDVATMIEGIKQAMSAGEISQQQIDDAVRRILMMKYEMGLLPIQTN